LMNETSQANEQMLPKLGQLQGNLGQQAQSTGFPQAAQQMAMAAQALGHGQRIQAMQRQQEAMDSLMKQMDQTGMRDMMSMMGFRLRLSFQKRNFDQRKLRDILPLFGRSSLVTMPVPGSGRNEDAYRYFDQMPMGFRQSGNANWNPLPLRELEAFYQNYAHELPTEYRKLLEEYYETLSE
jgi:hypothetical protein